MKYAVYKTLIEPVAPHWHETWKILEEDLEKGGEPLVRSTQPRTQYLKGGSSWMNTVCRAPCTVDFKACRNKTTRSTSTKISRPKGARCGGEYTLSNEFGEWLINENLQFFVRGSVSGVEGYRSC